MSPLSKSTYSPYLTFSKAEWAKLRADTPMTLSEEDLDPLGGLTEQECKSLIATINDVRASGVSIIWIEHVVHALLAVVDRLIVIDFGRKIAEGQPDEIMASREVQEIYLGIEAGA